MLFSERSASSTPLNNQLPVPTRQNSIKSFRSLSSHNGYVQVDQQQQQQDLISSSGGGSAQRLSLHSRQSSFRSVVGSLLFDGQTSAPHTTEYQHNDLSPPEQQLTDDLKDDLHDSHRDDDTEACSSCRSIVVVIVVLVSVVVVAVFVVAVVAICYFRQRRRFRDTLRLFIFVSVGLLAELHKMLRGIWLKLSGKVRLSPT